MTRRLPKTALIVISLLIVAVTAGCGKSETPTSVYRPDLEYLKALNDAGPARDPQIILLLAAQYLNANQTGAGIEFFDAFLAEHEDRLPARLKGVYLSALGLLRAVHTKNLALIRRPGWVTETIDILEDAKRLSGNDIFVVRWIAGIVYARLPGFFGKREDAISELEWSLANIDKAPSPGWRREIYFHLALANGEAGNEDAAAGFLKRSGYSNLDKTITLTTPYAVNAKTGFAFNAERIREVVPGRIFAISGVEFTEYYFIVSEDGQQLVAIDAGSRPDSAEAAYKLLKRNNPELPPLSTVFITHAHWDHIGGYKFFRRINPDITFFARDNYRRELENVVTAPTTYRYFFGSAFSLDFIRDFKPDRMVGGKTRISIGGTRFELIPIDGGETSDGMFVNLPDYNVLFVGDFAMPYIGAPFLEEGNLDGLFAAIDTVESLAPKTVLHGHERLTWLFPSPSPLIEIKRHLEWLQGEVTKAIGKGMERSAIHRLNLIPPTILETPRTQVAYLVMRENVINRLYDQQTGYWRAGMDGMDNLGRDELGALLERYLDISEARLTEAVEAMLEAGDHELAARILGWTDGRYSQSPRLAALREQVFLKLMERFQETNPFKFIIYSEAIGRETPALK